MKFKVKNIPISKGLFATKDIKRGESIALIRGIIGLRDYKKGGMNESDIAINLDGKTLLEPFYPFTEINHSCAPNCHFVEFNDKKGIVRLQALRKIKKYEELRVDYGWEKRYAIPCVCGSKKCKGIIVES